MISGHIKKDNITPMLTRRWLGGMCNLLVVYGVVEAVGSQVLGLAAIRSGHEIYRPLGDFTSNLNMNGGKLFDRGVIAAVEMWCTALFGVDVEARFRCKDP